MKRKSRSRQIKELGVLVREEVSVLEIRNKLKEIAEQARMKVNTVGFEKLRAEILNFDHTTLDFYQYTDNFDREELTRCIYSTLKNLFSRAGHLKAWEEFDDPSTVSYHPSKLGDNPSKDIYCVSSNLAILEKLGVVTQLTDGTHYKSCSYASTCRRYRLDMDKVIGYLGYSFDSYRPTPRRAINYLQRKIDLASEVEVVVMASCLLVRPNGTSIGKARRRINAQKRLHQEGIELTSELTSKLDTEYGIGIDQARVVKNLYDGDVCTMMDIIYDNYGSRMYHHWTSVDKKVRESAVLNKELRSEKLVEIDLSQCNYFMMYQRYREEGGIPTTMLQTAIKSGKIREMIAIAAEGEYTDQIKGKDIKIDFDSIRGLSTANSYKEQLKLFTLKAANCTFGSVAQKVHDNALANIDPNFAKWLRNKRRGWKPLGGSGKQSMAPYIAQRGEVEFMLGRKINHLIPNDGLSVKDMPSEVTTTDTAVLPIAVRRGVRFFLPIHDAIVCLERDVPAILDSLVEASEARGYDIVPTCKLHDSKTDKKRVVNYGYMKRIPPRPDEEMRLVENASRRLSRVPDLVSAFRRLDKGLSKLTSVDRSDINYNLALTQSDKENLEFERIMFGVLVKPNCTNLSPRISYYK